MMFLPLVLIFILPKMMNDPETRKEMENIQMPKYEMPEMSQVLTNLFGNLIVIKDFLYINLRIFTY